jgi:hypothetical protein
MRKRSEPRAPAAKMLGEPLIAQLAAGLKRSALSASAAEAMHERILQRIREGAPEGTFTEMPPAKFRIA